MSRTLLHALHRLAARPAQSLLAIGILSLGLGATMFLFGAISGMVLQPLPFPHAERLVALGFDRGPGRSLGEFDSEQWLAVAPLLSGVEAVAIDGGVATVNLGRASEVSRYDGAFIDAGMLPMLGVQPLLGRGFSSADDRPGAPLTVLLAEHVWRNDFGADPAIVGRTLRANGEDATIIGVMAAGFAYPRQQEVWLPRRIAVDDGLAVNVIARLAPGVSTDQLQLSLDALGLQLHDRFDELRDEGHTLGFTPLAHRFVNDLTRRMLWTMFAAGLLILLLACANVANLQLAQVLGRRRELAVRSALGAGRGRLLRDLLAESLVLSLVSGVIGFVLSVAGGELVARSMIENDNVPAYFIDFATHWRDIAFCIGIAFATCLLAGLLPALRAAGTDVQDALRDGSRGSHGGIFLRISNALVVGEIALTVVLLVGAAMFIDSLQGMLRLDFGTDTPPEQVLTARIGLFPQQFPQPADQHAFFERVTRALQADPHVLAASAGSALPGSLAAGEDPVRAFGAARPAAGDVVVKYAGVDPGFADVYGLRLVAGRQIDARDGADALPVAVVDSALAQTLWPGREAIGQRLVLDPDDAAATPLTVIGVVQRLDLGEIDDRRRSTVLRPFAQMPTRFATVAVHLRGDDAMAFAPRLAEIVRGVDADTPVYWVRTQAEAIRLGRAGPVLLTQIFSGVGALALLLAVSGLYGVLVFSVVQRTREIGIRRAIGAGARGVVQMVARRVAWQLAIGLGIGVALALPWSAVLADPVLDTRAGDPLLFGSVVGLILLVAIAAGLAPMLRALRVDPLVALRQD